VITFVWSRVHDQFTNRSRGMAIFRFLITNGDQIMIWSWSGSRVTNCRRVFGDLFVNKITYTSRSGFVILVITSWSMLHYLFFSPKVVKISCWMKFFFPPEIVEVPLASVATMFLKSKKKNCGWRRKIRCSARLLRRVTHHDHIMIFVIRSWSDHDV
jgi:hypothetical protein